jgi:hypothetical protein
MRKPVHALLFLAAAISIAPAAIADSATLGPLTFGGGTPIDSSDSFFLAPNFVQLWIDGPDGFGAGATPSSLITTFAFSFSIAPGWAISGMNFSLTGIDDIAGEDGDPPPIWGYEVDEEMIFCSAANICSTAGYSTGEGPGWGEGAAPLNPHAGPGTGVFEIELSAVNDTFGFEQPGSSVLNISLTQTSPVPEPSSWLLLGTSLLGLGGMISRKRA